MSCLVARAWHTAELAHAQITQHRHGQPGAELLRGLEVLPWGQEPSGSGGCETPRAHPRGCGVLAGGTTSCGSCRAAGVGAVLWGCELGSVLT